MDLLRAFNIRPGESVALTGAGGKSGLMFALAQALYKPVVMTTTTHLGLWQAPLAEHHLIIQPGDDLKSQYPETFTTLLITGPPGTNDRLTALDEVSLNTLRNLCCQEGWTLLIEADGSKQRPLKTPAEHEPVVPSWVDMVIVVAGMSALGQPLSEDWVHRPKQYAKLSDLSPGETITDESIAAVLGSQQGGLQGLPDNARKLIFLSQADTEITQAAAQRIAWSLNDAYSDVLIGSLHEPGQDGPIFSAQIPVAGVILAAGGSLRLGKPKQLLDWQGQVFISQLIKNALEAGLAPLIVVTGADSDRIQQEIAGMPVDFVHNPDWQEGQSTSMKAGLGALPAGCQSVMFLLSDQPQVSPILIRQLVETWYEERKPITAPQVNGKRANPVLFAKETFEALTAITGDKGGRLLFDRFETSWLPWTDERITLDVDEGDDYRKLIDSYFGIIN